MYALQRAAEESKHKEPEACGVIKSRSYVDDCLQSSDCCQELISVARAVAEVCKGAGFILRKYQSNFDMGTELELLEPVEDVIKVLGVKWNLKKDTLTPKFTVKGCPRTKRELLSLIASVYDPLGVLAPVILMGRIIF